MSETIKRHSKIAVVIGLILAMLGLYVVIPAGLAATLANREVKVDDSQVDETAVDYDFEYDDSNTTVKCIKVQFCDAPKGGCTLPTNMVTTSADKGDSGDWNNYTYANWNIDNATNGTVYYYYTTGETASGTDDSFEIGNIENADVANDYYARIQTWNPGSCSDRATCCATTTVDDGVAAFYIIAGVQVTASVPESLTMSIANVTAANCADTIGGTDRSDETGHDADTVPFGSIDSFDAFYFSCQEIQVGTNAGSGYTTTVFEEDQLTSGGNQIADGTCDTTCSETVSAAWATATNNGFGYCCEDQTGNACLTTDASDDAGTGAVDWVAANQCDDATPFFKIFPEETVDSPDRENVMKSYSAVSTNDQIDIGYKISVDATQAQGSYSTTTVYITTPLY